MTRSLMNSIVPALAATALALGGCDNGAAPLDEQDLEVVADGKADNYYSNVAAEFEVTGSIPVTMTEAQYKDENVRKDMVTRRLTAVGLYLTTYVTNKFRGIDKNGDGQITDDEVFFHNETYGGFSAMVRNRSLDKITVTGDATTGYKAAFSFDMAGPKDLLKSMPRAEGTDPSMGFLFDLQMPKDATMDPANVQRGVVRNFDPKTYSGALETHRLKIAQLADVGNAYPGFADMMADGVYDVTMFFGHDYNTSRSDLSEAREAFSRFVSAGFKAPVAKFEDLKADSGPFTRAMTANGKSVSVELRIFHSDMFTTDRKGQHDLALAEIAKRDVFFYNGHAGPYYGFYLDANDQAKVYPQEFATAPFKSGQQLVIAQGCQTYSQYADMLYASPAKDESNLDVITTVNYSYGQGTLDIFDAIMNIDPTGAHRPTDFYAVVSAVNADWTNSYHDVFYGIIGIDGNPQLHPYAKIDSIGNKCSKPSDCGDAAGNLCARNLSVSKTCAAVALSAKACPAGTKFKQVASGTTIKSGACFK